MATQKFPAAGVIADAVAAYPMVADAAVSSSNPLPVGGPAIGTAADTAYADSDGSDAGTMIALLKGIYVQLVAINANTAT
jgi:hypothetical protein